jgi:hypothetical protein
MKLLSNIYLIMGLVLISNTAVAAEGSGLEKISVSAEKVGDEAVRTLIGVDSRVRTDRVKLDVNAKYYLSALAEDYEEDKYSSLKAGLKLPQFSEEMGLSASYRWNRNYQFYGGAVKYQWEAGDCWDFQAEYAFEYREDLEPSRFKNNYLRQNQEFSLKFKPEGKWDYKMDASRSDKVYPHPYSPGTDYSSLKYTLNQEVDYQANDRLKLGLGYRVATTDNRSLSRKDGFSQKWTVKGDYAHNEYWSWEPAYTQSWGSGTYGERRQNNFNLDGVYKSGADWKITGKLRLSDLMYSSGYYPDDEAAEGLQDPDDDYRSRRTYIAAAEYERKLTALSYGVEIFCKYFEYDSATMTVEPGVSANINWNWLRLDWRLKVAPQGDLRSRKAKYQLKAEYKF